VTSSDTKLSIGRDVIEDKDPRLAFGLAILIGILVFVFLWRIRKTFGMKE
jgi:hypothetical protein